MNIKSAKQVENFLDNNLHLMEHPFAYYGGEPNTVMVEQKPWQDMSLHVNFFAAWSYLGVPGNQTVPLLVQLMNDAGSSIFCDRSFFPCCKKDLNKFEKAGTPIFGLNSRRSLGEFDVIATSLSFPLFYPNIVKQLRMSGIPVLWEDRASMEEAYPLIIAGGCTYGNPEVWSPIVDLLFIGEAEDEENYPGIQAVMRYIDDWNRNTIEKSKSCAQQVRNDLLRALCQNFEFLFCPRFHKPIYDEETKYVTGFDYSGLEKPKRKYVHNLDAVPALDCPPLAYYDPSMGSGEVEGARGCVGSCIFCSNGLRYRPYRERSVDCLVRLLKENYKNTGATVAFPCFFDFSGYTQKHRLVKKLLEEVSSYVDTQSSRVDNIVEGLSFIELVGEGGMKQLAIGLEGASQRLRDMVNKQCSIKDILKVCDFAMKNGFKRIKFYAICDLMYENDDDDKCLLELMRRIAEMRDAYGLKMEIKISFTPLRIEANTPLQWGRTSTYIKQIGGIPDGLRALRIQGLYGSKVNVDRTHFIQLFHLSDRLAARAMVNVCIEYDYVFFSGPPAKYTERMAAELAKIGLDYEHYFCEKPEDFIFPWDIADMGVSKEYLLKFWRKAKKFMEDNPDALAYEKASMERDGVYKLMTKCRDCNTCGCCETVADKEYQKSLWKAEDEEVSDLSSINIIDDTSVAESYLLKIVVPEERRYVPNEHWEYQIRRACYLLELPVSKDSIKLDSDSIRYKNWGAGIDYVEIGFTKKPDKYNQPCLELLNTYLHYIQVLEWKLSASTFSLMRDCKERYSLHEFELVFSPVLAKQAIDVFYEKKYIEMILRFEAYIAGMQREKVNLKDYCSHIWLVNKGHKQYVRLLIKGRCTAYDVYCAVFKNNMGKAMKNCAFKLETFAEQSFAQQDFFRPVCLECGNPIPETLMGYAYHDHYCPVHEFNHSTRG